MPAYIALLRAVNLGGSSTLPMRDLVAMCERAGFTSVRTYIASGNAIFSSAKGPGSVQRALEQALLDYAGKPVGVHIRTAGEMAQVLARNPFPHAPGNRTVALFLAGAPPADALDEVRGAVNEECALGEREIYVHYVDGIGRSKLRIPAAKDCTARNMNTVAKLAELGAALANGKRR